jgi:hypothetical protein
MIRVSKFDFAKKLIVVDQTITNFDLRIFDFAPQQRFERENVAASGGSFPRGNTGISTTRRRITGTIFTLDHQVHLVARSQRFTYTNV